MLGSLTYARSILIPRSTPGTFHCVSRCVRRAFLCGEDRLTGLSFEHRRQWVEDRIHELAGIFGVGLCGDEQPSGWLRSDTVGQRNSFRRTILNRCNPAKWCYPALAMLPTLASLGWSTSTRRTSTRLGRSWRSQTYVL